MKRSEAVKKLETLLLEAFRMRDFTDEDSGEYVLAFIESLGMLPPPVDTDVIDSRLVYCYYTEPGIVSTENYKIDLEKSRLWEPE